MVQMNLILIFISSSEPNLSRKKSVKQKIKKQWPYSYLYHEYVLVHVCSSFHKLTFHYKNKSSRIKVKYLIISMFSCLLNPTLPAYAQTTAI